MPIREKGTELIFRQEEVLFEQGAPSKGAYIVLDGIVDLWHEDNGKTTKVASVYSGDLIGEGSVIEGRNHSVTAIAAKPTSAMFVDADIFRKTFADPLVRFVVTTLSARLRSSYEQANFSHQDQPPPAVLTVPTLSANSEELKKLMQPTPLSTFPFIVGNGQATESAQKNSSSLLLVPMPSNTNFDRNHFEIIRRDGGLFVRDLGSFSGTIVNGRLLKKYEQSAVAPLKPGKNIIEIADGMHRLEFLLRVPWSMMPS